ncbi:MAG: NADAR family protein [Acidobacteria bacterium]|nr:NADAR family protein [Acidobacteriota bacterium]
MTENIRSREDLLRAVRSGLRPKYLFFWGHKPLPNGEIGKPCFSQWWPAPFSVDGVSYPTAEHFMMAEKARLFSDGDARAQILKAGSPKTAKQLGRQVKNFSELVWGEMRFQLVVSGNLAKYSQNHELREYLLGTGDKILVEASPVDRIWGIGLAADNEQAMNPERWRGLNLLGFALMEVRQRLQGG